jgi:hypothetical protein
VGATTERRRDKIGSRIRTEPLRVIDEFRYRTPAPNKMASVLLRFIRAAPRHRRVWVQDAGAEDGLRAAQIRAEPLRVIDEFGYVQDAGAEQDG